MKPGGSSKTGTIRTTLIAPCGMNCRLCHAYARDKNVCPGCRGDVDDKPHYCITCRIRNCGERGRGRKDYCFSCDSFPCGRLKHLDKRYRTKYHMSMMRNLMSIQESGVRQFVRDEKERWTCPVCGGIICVHKPKCLSCGYEWRVSI